MRLLVIIMSRDMNINSLPNIQNLNDSLKKDHDIHYCGISNTDDFVNYESVIRFKYKIIDTSLQLNKICNFIDLYKNELNYDWYIKIRPEIMLLEPIDFSILYDNAINARARQYIGPKRFKYGMSINGEGSYKNIGDCFYDEIEKQVVLDDQIYIFHQNIINMGAFERFDINTVPNEFYKRNNIIYKYQHEWFHDNFWKHRNIPLNVIGIYAVLKGNTGDISVVAFSGDLNM